MHRSSKRLIFVLAILLLTSMFSTIIESLPLIFAIIILDIATTLSFSVRTSSVVVQVFVIYFKKDWPWFLSRPVQQVV